MFYIRNSFFSKIVILSFVISVILKFRILKFTISFLFTFYDRVISREMKTQNPHFAEMLYNGFYHFYYSLSLIKFSYSRGMKFENVQLLIDEMQDEISRMNYCWVDNQGLISKQNGVFRVNCIDCLDRTNVVQVGLETQKCFVFN